ncbi:MAG: hypothetical protein HQ463_07490 [Bacteroidetes bacterium]|nr:hypothetical protein [Bacteroidota bacterium]
MLPKEIVFEGNIKNLKKLIDLKGEHIIILTETGYIPSKTIKYSDHEADAKIFSYDYLLNKTENKYQLYWKIQDFESNCEFDLMMGYLKNTFQITYLNKDGIAEIWIMYQKGCSSDVSPNEMKIIMHEGNKKFALRGIGLVDLGNFKEGGTYKLDDNFNNASNEIKNFVVRSWKDNCKQKYE